MDDEEYARELFEILTRPPDPNIPTWELGPDWIDRHSGFGTEVKVTSVDIVPGPYGAQIEVGFALDVPDGLDVPPEGSFLLPLDREWRALSGYTEPEDYAPKIASEVESKVRDHVAVHTRGRRARRLPSREKQHALLLQVLGRYGEVEEERAGRYVVRHPEGDEIVVVLTSDEWEQILLGAGPPHDDIDTYEELFAAAPEEQRFWVFWDGRLTSSIREELPPVKVPRPPMREVKQQVAAAKASGKAFGWFAYTPTKGDQLPG